MVEEPVQAILDDGLKDVRGRAVDGMPVVLDGQHGESAERVRLVIVACAAPRGHRRCRCYVRGERRRTVDLVEVEGTQAVLDRHVDLLWREGRRRHRRRVTHGDHRGRHLGADRQRRVEGPRGGVGAGARDVRLIGDGRSRDHGPVTAVDRVRRAVRLGRVAPDDHGRSHEGVAVRHDQRGRRGHCDAEGELQDDGETETNQPDRPEPQSHSPAHCYALPIQTVNVKHAAGTVEILLPYSLTAADVLRIGGHPHAPTFPNSR